jgi:hypothetical protein
MILIEIRNFQSVIPIDYIMKSLLTIYINKVPNNILIAAISHCYQTYSLLK